MSFIFFAIFIDNHTEPYVRESDSNLAGFFVTVKRSRNCKVHFVILNTISECLESSSSRVCN